MMLTRIGELGATLSVTSNRSTLRSISVVFILSVLLLLVTANDVPSTPIRVTLVMEAMFLRNVGSYKSHAA
jgi:hypothetical protein